MDRDQYFDITNEQALKETRKFGQKISAMNDYKHNIGHALALNVISLKKAGFATDGLMRVGLFGDTEVFAYVTVSMPILVNGNGDVKSLSIEETVKKGEGA